MKQKILEINKGVDNGFVPIDITSKDYSGHRLFYVARKCRLTAIVVVRRLAQYAAIAEKGHIHPSSLAKKFKDYYLDTDR